MSFIIKKCIIIIFILTYGSHANDVIEYNYNKMLREISERYHQIIWSKYFWALSKYF